MPTRTSRNIGRPTWVGDHGSMRLLPGGRQIDWANVPAGFVDATTGKKVLHSGTPMVVIDATGLMVPRGKGAATAGRSPLGLLTSDAHEGYGPGLTEAISGYGIVMGAVVYTELLPKWHDASSILDATVITELKALDGGGFAFETYADNRAS